MTKKQVLDFKPALRLEQVDAEHCERMQEREHRPRSCDDSIRRCDSRPDEIFGKDNGSIAVAEDKARSALYYRRPSKVFEDLVAQGGLGIRTLALRGASPLEGGIPLIADGKIIGAIGASGATSVQDGQVAKAGADVTK